MVSGARGVAPTKRRPDGIPRRTPLWVDGDPDVQNGRYPYKWVGFDASPIYNVCFLYCTSVVSEVRHVGK